MQPIRLGIIGTGLIWIRAHQRIIETLNNAFVPVAFADLSERRRAALVQAYPNTPVYEDYRQLLELPEVDAVLVLTPLTLNAPVARAALLAGKHVIMEKPIARSVAEGQELAEIARQAGKRLLVAEQLAYRHAEMVLATIIASGEIGDLVMWDRVHHLEADTAEGEMRYDSTPWRKQADFPLGTMFDGGIHLIASLSSVFGAPETLVATGRALRHEYGEYDHIAAMFHYPGAVTGILSFSSYLSSSRNHFYIYGTTGAILVEPERILIEPNDRPERVVPLAPENAYQSMWHAFARAFHEPADVLYTPAYALRDVAILEAINQAIKTGERVPVNMVESVQEA